MAEAEKTQRRPAKKARCVIYTRKSSEEGLEQAFNSLDAQREACAAFILSQKHQPKSRQAIAGIRTYSPRQTQSAGSSAPICTL
jgi:hypothetical protein